MEVITRNSPRFASSLAVSLPMPVFAPVTMTVLPARDTDSITAEKTVHTDRFFPITRTN